MKRNKFLEWKLRKLLLIYRILFKQCEKSISKRLLLQLISNQILQITPPTENDGNNNQSYGQQRKNSAKYKMIIEMQRKLIEYITSKNSNLNNSQNVVSFLIKYKKRKN